MRDECPTCHRPFKKPKLYRDGDHPGLEREAAALMTPPETNLGCTWVLDALAFAAKHGDGWLSSKMLRDVLHGGDGPRRVRQLREQYGWPIERELRRPRQAWYRIDPTSPLLDTRAWADVLSRV